MDLSYLLWGNSIRQWLLASIVALCLYLVLALIRRRLNLWFSNRATDDLFSIRSVTGSLIRTVSSILLLAVALYIGSQFISLHHAIKSGLGIFLRLALFYQLGRLGQAIIDLLVGYMRGRTQDRLADSAVIGFSLLGKVVLWIVLILVSLENLGVNMTTLIASLGVGGIAIGLAMQRVVGDLIASLAIVLDRPFTHGDFISIDTVSGTVEKIGLKTTRIRSISGEELVIPNTDLIQGRIHNYRSLMERRVVFGFGVTYDTSADQLQAIPALVAEIIGSEDNTRFDRAHFKQFGTSSLDFEVVYYVTTADYLTYMNIQQSINLRLVRAFSSRGIEFALPTQTVFVHPISSAATSGNRKESITP